MAGLTRAKQRRGIQLGSAAPSAVFTSSIVDFDRYTELMQRWDLQTWLLSSGGFRAELLYYVDPERGHHYSHTTFHSTVRQIGSPPPRLRTFVIPANTGESFIWRGHVVSGHDVLLFPAGSELDASVKALSEVLVVSISEETFAAHADALGYGNGADLLRENEVFRCRPGAVDQLRKALLRYEGALLQQGDESSSPLFDEALESLVMALHSTPDAATRDTLRTRERVVHEVQRYADEHAEEVLTVQDLSQVTGVTIRTLQIGFRQLFGVTPKAYLRAQRLNRVRAVLAARDAGTTVIADVANNWGFWHMGQFAADYRKLFGELPSQTLGTG